MNRQDHWNRIRGLRTDIDPGEQFLESSKLGLYDDFPSQEAIVGRMLELLEAFPYEGYPATPLPAPTPIDTAFSQVISSRVSARFMKPQQLELPHSPRYSIMLTV